MKNIPIITALLVSLLFSVSIARADAVLLNDDVPRTYVVKPGDTLWDISALFLQDP